MSWHIVVMKHSTMIFPQLSCFCERHSSNVKKRLYTMCCLVFDNMEWIHNGLSNQKTPLSYSCLTNICELHLAEEILFPPVATNVSWFQHHSCKPGSYFLLWCFQEVFINTNTNKQFLSNVNMVFFFSHRSKNVAQIFRKLDSC